MKEKIQQLKDLKQELTLELKEWVKDKTIPLDERWDLFFQSDLGDHRTWIEDFKNLDSDNIAKNRDVNRHETIYLDTIEEWYIKSIEDSEKYDEFREDVLSKFIQSFEWDW